MWPRVGVEGAEDGSCANSVPLHQVGPCLGLWLEASQLSQVAGFGSGISRRRLRDRGSWESSKGMTHAHKLLWCDVWYGRTQNVPVGKWRGMIKFPSREECVGHRYKKTWRLRWNFSWLLTIWQHFWYKEKKWDKKICLSQSREAIKYLWLVSKNECYEQTEDYWMWIKKYFLLLWESWIITSKAYFFCKHDLSKPIYMFPRTENVYHLTHYKFLHLIFK